MQVHIFGATSPPSCACFALLQTAEDHASSFNEDVTQRVGKNFYIDDCLISVSNVQQATEITKQLSLLLRKGRFHLNEWISNHESILSHLPPEDVSKFMLNLHDRDKTCYERALGLR